MEVVFVGLCLLSEGYREYTQPLVQMLQFLHFGFSREQRSFFFQQ